MRLPEKYAETIRQTFGIRFGADAKVSLFGSRVNDNAGGGDIDLLVELFSTPANPFLESIGLETDLQMALGDQKIDILLIYLGCAETPIHRIAKHNAIQL